MTKSVEILIELNGEKHYLDYDKLDGISLNYNINRIQDIQNLDSSYSQSIKLVNSKNNQNILGYISNLNVENGKFDPNKKTKCYVLVDGIQVFDGYLQLLGISYTDINEVYYDSVIYADNANLYTSIENKFLTDLDLSKYKYVYNFDTFLKTATSSCDKDAIIFPLIDYGANWRYSEVSGTGSSFGLSSSQIDMNELYPSTYVKTIFDQIFIDSGYKYESEFLNLNPQDGGVFKNLVVPFNNDSLVSSINIDNNNYLGVTSTTFSTLLVQGGQSSNLYETIFKKSIYSTTADTRYNFGTQEYQNDGTSRYERFGIDVDMTIMLGKYQYSKVLYQPSVFQTQGLHLVNGQQISIEYYRQYNPSTNSLDVNPTNLFYSKVIFNSIDNRSALTSVNGPNNGLGNNITDISTNLLSRAYSTNGTTGAQFYPVGSVYKLGDEKLNLTRNPFVTFYNATPSGTNQNWVNYLDMGRLTSTDTLWTPWLDGSKPELLPLYANERIQVRFRVVTNAQVNPVYDPSISVGNPKVINSIGAYPDTSSLFLSLNDIYDGRSVFSATTWSKDPNILFTNSLYSESTTQVSIGTSIPVSLNLPQNIKQIDFLKSIVKMFNLYIEPIQGRLKTFKIEPRDDYYKNSSVKNWSSKVDLSKQFSSDILSNTQAKETIFKYTEDEDYFNTLYTKTFNETYGEYKYIISNEFVTGTNEIQLIFSPTPLKKLENSDIILSTIQKALEYNQEPKTGSKLRILYCDTLDIPNNQTIVIEKTRFNKYIYAGHFDNPYDPLMDLSFRLPKKLYYNFLNGDGAKLTYNSLYNLYYRKQFKEINNNDGRLLKVYLRLDEVDIYNFKFSDTIYIYINGDVNGYFRINSISEFDPVGEKPALVELIKIDFTPSNIETSKTSFYTTELKSNTLILGSLNTYDSSTFIVGRRNSVKGVFNNVSGSNNNLEGDTIKVFGSDNNVNGNSINITGNSNQIVGSKIDVTGSSNISTYSVLNGRINGDGNLITQAAESIQIAGSNNTIGVTNSTNKIQSVSAFGNNNFLNISNGMVVGSDNTSIGSLNNVYFFGDSTLLEAHHNNKVVVADNLTFQVKKMVVDGLDNGIGSNNAFIFGNNNEIIYNESNFNSIFGNQNQIGPDTTSNIVLGNGNALGPKLTNSFVMGSDNTINAQDPSGDYITLSNVFIMSNSPNVYKLNDDMFFVDLTKNLVTTRQKIGSGDFGGLYEPDYSAFTEIKNTYKYPTLLRSGSYIYGTDAGQPDREPTKPFTTRTYYQSTSTQSSGWNTNYLSMSEDVYSYIKALTQSGTTYSCFISYRDNNNISSYNPFYIMEVETYITSNFLNNGVPYWFHNIDYVYVIQFSGIFYITPVIQMVKNVVNTTSFTFSIGVTYSAVNEFMNADYFGVGSQIVLAQDTDITCYTNIKFRNTYVSGRRPNF